jgi:broad specificity phosphatase PhoE
MPGPLKLVQEFYHSRVLKVIEVRRHTHRDEQENLTEEGKRVVGIAKKTRASDYSAAYSSPAKRAILTLQEFGFTDYMVEPALAFPTKEEAAPYREILRQLGPSTEAMFSHPDISRILMSAGVRVLEALVKITDYISEGSSVFAVSHGGTMEATALTAFGKGSDLNSIGGRLHVCEGFRVYLVNRTVTRLDLLRLPQASPTNGLQAKSD